MTGSNQQKKPKRTLIFEIALPSYHLDDWDETSAFYDPIWNTLDLICNESGLSSLDVKVGLLLGDKGGTSVEYVKARILSAKVVDRQPDHELAGDERLDEMDRDFANQCRGCAERAPRVVTDAGSLHNYGGTMVPCTR